MEDERHLQLLSVFHYVLAALTAFAGCFPFLHLALGIAIASGALREGSGEPPPEFIGWVIIVVAALFIVAFWTLAICIAVAGRGLARRERYGFCFFVACAECAFPPLCTILGVFTLIVLTRPTVKALFGVQPAMASSTFGPPSR